MLPFIQSHSTAILVCGGILALVVVNLGPGLVARLRQRKSTSVAWPDDKPAPPAFTTYIAALEAAGLAPPDTLSVARGGLCPNAAKVIKAVKG